MPAPHSLFIERHQGPLTEAMTALLLMADPSLDSINAYLPDSTLFLAQCNQQLAGLAVVSVVPECELLNLAVTTSYQKQGIAKQLIESCCQYSVEQGAGSILVATGNSSLDQLALYQKSGFRIEGVRANAFTGYAEPIFENGIACLDQILLRRCLIETNP